MIKSKIYRHSENGFEKLTSLATSILGNSITFILALIAVIYWLCNDEFLLLSRQQKIADIILGITFLSLFIIQKSFNRFSASLHLKLNELLVSHEPAKNSIINVENKTELEIVELTKEYNELVIESNEIELEKEKILKKVKSIKK